MRLSPNIEYSTLGKCWYVTKFKAFKDFEEMRDNTKKFDEYKEAAEYWVSLLNEYYREETV